MVMNLVSGSAALSSLAALSLLPMPNFVVDTPDMSELTQVTAENDEVRSGDWYSPLRAGSVRISFGADWNPSSESEARLAGIPEEYRDDAQRFQYQATCNTKHTVAYMDEQDRLHLSGSRMSTLIACPEPALKDERGLESILDAGNTTLHLDEEGDLWLVAGEKAIEMQREIPDEIAFPVDANLSSMSSMSSR